MDSLIATFHLDVKLILAQIVNFAVVAGVLWWFALKPLLKILTERSATITKSLAEAKEIEQRLLDTKNDHDQVIGEARREALAVVEAANARAEEQRQSMVTKAKAEVEKIVSKGKEQLAAEKMAIISEAQHEIVALVTQVTAKVLGGELPASVDRQVIERSIKDLAGKK